MADTDQTVENSAGDQDVAEKITVEGKEYTLDEINAAIKQAPQYSEKLKLVMEREKQLENATKEIRPFLEALQNDPEEAERMLNDLIKTARSGHQSDHNPQLEAMEKRIADIQLDVQIKEMTRDKENYPYFAENATAILEIAEKTGDIEEAYHAWTGRNFKRLEKEAREKAEAETRKAAGGITGGRTATKGTATGEVFIPGRESMYSFLKRTGRIQD